MHLAWMVSAEDTRNVILVEVERPYVQCDVACVIDSVFVVGITNERERKEIQVSSECVKWG
jgi:hypothetical protein